MTNERRTTAGCGLVDGFRQRKNYTIPLHKSKTCRTSAKRSEDKSYKRLRNRNGSRIAYVSIMKLFGLTNHGLAAIGLLTLVLWGILWEEHSLNLRTQEIYRILIQDWPATPAHNPAPQMPDLGSIS
jgi:hypothetical protein